MRNILLILAFAASLLASCSEKRSGPDASYFKSSEEGVKAGGVKLIPVTTPKGTFNVWTKRFGNNPKIRLLLLHGGPGATHEYFESLESYLPAEGIEFIYYDQLGSGNAEQPRDDDLWVTERFVEEVEQVRQALGLTKDNFYLLGHSWGGILAIEYALKHQEHIKGLIISNMMSSAIEYDRYAEEVLGPQMDPAVLKEVMEFEAKGEFQNPKYMELLMMHYYSKHILRLPDWPNAVMRTFNKLNHDVYVIMQGPSEFGISGRLEKWDRSKDLKNITVPTLVIGAQHDTMDPAHMKWMSTQVAQGSYLHCANGSHMCMWDDQDTFANGLIKFIKAVDAGNKRVEF